MDNITPEALKALNEVFIKALFAHIRAGTLPIPGLLVHVDAKGGDNG